MIFTTRTFFIFFGVFLTLYFLALIAAPSRNNSTAIKATNLLILASSLTFYGYSQPGYILLLLLSGVIDFLAALSIFRSKFVYQKKLYLVISIACNLGILFAFKYSDFALTVVDDFLGSSFIGDLLPESLSSISFEQFSVFKNVILPAGISFYTFQSMSYTIDVYRGSLNPTTDLLRFLTYLSFFPQLVAGPIERAGSLLPQFDYIKTFNSDNATKGFQLIIWGAFKKLVIADNIGRLVDQLYANYVPGSGSIYKTIIAGAGFGIQIYMDFSAYSEIAVGLALIIGFKLMINFKQPYMRANIREFWRSWNISLSQWFRDYIYSPLSTRLMNRSFRRELAQTSGVLSVFAISGIWHGSGYPYIVWGLINGIAYVVSLPLSIYKLKIWTINPLMSRIYGIFKYLTTLSLVCLSWIYFRSSTVSQANHIIIDSLNFSFSDLKEAKKLILTIPHQDLIGIVVAIILVFAVEFAVKDRPNSSSIFDLTKKPYAKLIMFLALIFGIQVYGTNTDAAFIYFNF